MEGTPFGRYRLISLLGRGGMGEVWRSFDTATNRVVAVKVLPANLADDPQFEARFRREAFAAAGLADPHVVPIHNFGEIDGRLYVDMRLIEGRDLQALLSEGPMDPVRAVGIIDQVASALDAAHQIGLVHRDVKPSNILVAARDFAYLIDFGIARAAGATKLTGTGNVIGTWAYLAPERVTSGQTDARADIYSLACVLHECLTGQQPFPGDSIEQQIGGHLGLPPPRPSQLGSGLPVALDTVIATGMAKNPDERYPTVTALTDAARAAIAAPSTVPAATLPTQAANRSGSIHTDPTEQRTPTDPSVAAPPDNFLKRHRIAVVGAIAAAAVLAVIAATVVPDDDADTTAAPTSTRQTSTAAADPGPFTGTFNVDFAAQTDSQGRPVEGAKPMQQVWNVRSVCRSSGCVAIASPGVQFPVKQLVFDNIGGRWLAVATSTQKCKDIDGERFDVISLERRADGIMSGEWTTANSQACFGKREATFTRTADAAGVTADPASLPPRVTSPAEALRGQYRLKRTFSNGKDAEWPAGVRTDCLRTGERCISYFVGPGSGSPFVFANGKWTERKDTFEGCGSGSGTAHFRWTGDFTLPQPAQDPIAQLSGGGRLERVEATCPLLPYMDFDMTIVRTGD